MCRGCIGVRGASERQGGRQYDNYRNPAANDHDGSRLAADHDDSHHDERAGTNAPASAPTTVDADDSEYTATTVADHDHEYTNHSDHNNSCADNFDHDTDDDNSDHAELESRIEQEANAAEGGRLGQTPEAFLFAR